MKIIQFLNSLTRIRNLKLGEGEFHAQLCPACATSTLGRDMVRTRSSLWLPTTSMAPQLQVSMAPHLTYFQVLLNQNEDMLSFRSRLSYVA